MKNESGKEGRCRISPGSITHAPTGLWSVGVLLDLLLDIRVQPDLLNYKKLQFFINLQKMLILRGLRDFVMLA